MSSFPSFPTGCHVMCPWEPKHPSEAVSNYCAEYLIYEICKASINTKANIPKPGSNQKSNVLHPDLNSSSSSVTATQLSSQDPSGQTHEHQKIAVILTFKPYQTYRS
ncbi:hypothetical protein N7489_006928 [Penicillium chrysogenum]|uniref:Uncharacterized protein n=1 Tax=Penicillium chrysogenum TaxID=5076 RepID=A0ABQ8W6D5_PENCH|nr:uncharacterized protein N7489_006928 [Penicillium chrysogenum]XP_061070966.1 uncharacterized protein N7525_001044 [Penicillium rubens]KAJ5236837.1 hypothetical protein N7489_006928 [Penicillium chrysogenum]KAJ5255736.1 hypothetical protein N7505_010887 [Penicillium chrysogenum]KAJ5843303.1 hypothetical protein N7525_001044 [Penicillium rubens]KAJ5846113.1 hypothetical protein N7534_009782 [Penicillium rubens]KAJ6152457.1 hypothetical protein N7497_006776 [Penicillium chrysogenum]